MDHDEPDAQRAQQRELAGDLFQRRGLRHHFAAHLDHEHMVAVGPDVAQGALEAGDALERVNNSHVSFLRFRDWVSGER